MASIRVRPNGNLFFDFRYQNIRCREQTSLVDIPVNRKRLEKVLEKIEAEIVLGTFDYKTYFPNSKQAEKFRNEKTINGVPAFNDFAERCLEELAVQWRASHKESQWVKYLAHIEPYFSDRPVTTITRADVMQFRATLAKKRGREPGSTMSPSAVNHIISVLNLIMAEASERYDFPNPCTGVKSLKVPRTQVEPFTLDEVQLIIGAVRKDYKPYYTIRFFTGMRTAEIDGLKWQYVDMERREILIRETSVRGQAETTKNDGSQREIAMSEPVYQAFKEQQKRTQGFSEYVFCTRAGTPISHNNVTKRVWYPLLRHLELKKRKPYQTRHTAATLWLASGENPEWIARQMGHATTEMLFRVYSRYVPNLTRNDGSAFERLLAANLKPEKENSDV